jgi:hypothetical protein
LSEIFEEGIVDGGVDAEAVNGQALLLAHEAEDCVLVADLTIGD